MYIWRSRANLAGHSLAGTSVFEVKPWRNAFIAEFWILCGVFEPAALAPFCRAILRFCFDGI